MLTNLVRLPVGIRAKDLPVINIPVFPIGLTPCHQAAIALKAKFFVPAKSIIVSLEINILRHEVGFPQLFVLEVMKFRHFWIPNKFQGIDVLHQFKPGVGLSRMPLKTVFALRELPAFDSVRASLHWSMPKSNTSKLLSSGVNHRYEVSGLNIARDRKKPFTSNKRFSVCCSRYPKSDEPSANNPKFIYLSANLTV